jgi:hypothetical protein
MGKKPYIVGKHLSSLTMETIVGNKSNKLDKYFYYIESIFILKGSKFFGEREHNFS